MLDRYTTLLSIIIFTFLAIFYACPSTPTPKQTAIMSLSSKLSITDVNLKGEKVLIRVDFNVP
jgi:phosphoglycerate kinase